MMLKKHFYTIFFAFFMLTFISVPSEICGIPEPGMIFFGKVIDKNGNRLTQETLKWTITSLADNRTIEVTTNLADVDGQYSYITQIPVESAVTGDPLSINALLIPTVGAKYLRTAKVNGIAATIITIPGESLTLTPETIRGFVQQVDMQINVYMPTPIPSIAPIITPIPTIQFPNQFRWGDLDGDGKDGTKDATLILQWKVGIIDRFPIDNTIIKPNIPPSGDLDGDGKLGTKDATLILKKKVGIIDRYPVDKKDPKDFGPDNIPIGKIRHK